jgi:hypothetical protein
MWRLARPCRTTWILRALQNVKIIHQIVRRNGSKHLCYAAWSDLALRGAMNAIYGSTEHGISLGITTCTANRPTGLMGA